MWLRHISCWEIWEYQNHPQIYWKIFIYAIYAVLSLSQIIQTSATLHKCYIGLIFPQDV